MFPIHHTLDLVALAIAGSAVAQVITENLSNVPVMLERLTAFVKEMKAATALR